MAITQNGAKSLIKSLFGYDYAGGAQSNAATIVSATVATRTVSLATGTVSVAAGTQVIVSNGGTTYVGLAKQAYTSVSSFDVDSWYSGTGGSTVTSSLTIGTATNVTLVAQPLPAYYLGLSTSTTLSPYGTVTETSFGELTANSLGRAKATVAVTSVSTPTGAANTTSTITLSNTWTATSMTGSITVADIAIFNAPYVAPATRGTGIDTLLFCTQVASNPVLSTNGDQLVVTETISQS